MSNLFDILSAHQKARDEHKNDGKKFALVIQGGGMRGVYSAGSVTTLIEYGLTNAFDHVIGSSAGAMHAAYYLAQDKETMRHTYSNDLTNKNFINLLRKDKKVDIDFLVDTVMKQRHPIDTEKLRLAPSQLHILLTDAMSGKSVDISDHRSFAEIYEELRATAALPLLYDQKVLVRGKYYIDGGVANLIPINVATKLKCTDIVVVMTQQISSYHFDKGHDRLVKHLVKKFAKNYSPRLKSILPYDEKITQVNLRLITNPHRNVRFYVLEPSNEEILISLATRDRQKVETLAKLGVSDMDLFLHKSLDETSV